MRTGRGRSLTSSADGWTADNYSGPIPTCACAQRPGTARRPGCPACSRHRRQAALGGAHLGRHAGALRQAHRADRVAEELTRGQLGHVAIVDQVVLVAVRGGPRRRAGRGRVARALALLLALLVGLVLLVAARAPRAPRTSAGRVAERAAGRTQLRQVAADIRYTKSSRMVIITLKSVAVAVLLASTSLLPRRLTGRAETEQ